MERNIKRLINPEQLKLMEQDNYISINQLNYDKFAENKPERFNKIDNLKASRSTGLIPRFDPSPKAGIKSTYSVSVTGPSVSPENVGNTGLPGTLRLKKH